MMTHSTRWLQRNLGAVDALVWLLVISVCAATTPHAEAGGVFHPPIGPFADGNTNRSQDGVRYTATADLNHDGHLDLVGVRNATDEVSIRLGAGDGTFPTELLFPVGNAPFGAAVGDFDEDGHLDVAVSNRPDISVLLGNGDGTLQPEIRHERGTRFSEGEVAIGDLNGDGHEDIVVTGDPPAGVSVFLGAGDGTFMPPSHYSTYTTRLRTIVIADLNGDNVPDLVVGNRGCCGYLSVLLGAGDGSFGPPEIFETPGIPISLALTDLDADGELDVVTSTWGSSLPTGLSVLQGNGDGTLGAASAPLLNRDSFAVAAADFDRDGRVDVAASFAQPFFSGPQEVSLFLGAGDGALTLRESFEVSQFVDHILIGDFNGDDFPDLVASSTAGAFLLLNRGGFPPGLVDDSDRDDLCFGIDEPPVCDATDIKLVETHVDLCDFECAGGPELCCGPDSGGEEALIIHMEIIGEPSLPRLHQGEFKVFLDFGEAVDLDGDEIPDLSLKDAIEEPGVGPLDTSDVRVRASFGQSSSPHGGNRFGTQVRFTANAGLNPRVGRLSRIDQVASTIDFVLPLAEILTAADEAQKAAAGIEEGAESVEFLLWWSSRCDGNILDRVPNTDDHGSPSVVFEASLFLAPFLQLELLGPDRTTGAVDFRGFDQCGGGDGDAVVVGTSSQPQSIILFNPSLMPLVVNDLVFSDPSFSTTAAFPIVVPALAGEISVPVVFQPDIEGPVTAIVTVLGDDPTPPALSLLGEGVPDDPPTLSQCFFDSTSVTDKTTLPGEPFVIRLHAADSATLSNIASCSATAFLSGTITPVEFPLLDDGSDGDGFACDGYYTASEPTGTLLGLGRWVFKTECLDRQGHITQGESCSLLVDQDTDGDGIIDSRDLCPLDPLDDADSDGLCANEDNCPIVPNNGAPSNGFSGGIADTCLDPGAPHCVRLDFITGVPDVPLCVDAGGNNDLTSCSNDAQCTVTPGFDTCAEVPWVACFDRAHHGPFSFCRLGPAAFDAFGAGFPNLEFDNADCLANEPPGCVSGVNGRLLSQGCSPGDSCGTDIQADTDGDGVGDACEP